MTVRAGDQLRQLAQAATPGPWSLDGIAIVGGGNRFPNGQPYIAQIQGNTADKQASGRLIALAPDLAVLVADLADALEQADKEASIAHDAIWHDSVAPNMHLHDNDLADSANTAIWRLHEHVRPLLARVVALADPGAER